MAPVQLYVYDLSRGMAKQMSLPLTGKQIDGIWHTSVVVFGREIFYGQGILESVPGATHHGQPVQLLDMGDTQIDQATFDEYLHSLAELYTADAYHLIEFNCNNFTADVVGFLTGQETPKWITGLPAEFLATPFGQMLKPQIDAMFRSRSSSEHRVNPGTGSSTPTEGATPARAPTPAASAINGSASSLLNSVASAATSAPATSSPLASSSTTAPPSAPASALTPVTSSANFQSLLKSHHLVVNFTNTPGCPPCRVIKPIFESIASSYSSYAARSPGLRFVEIELGVGEGRVIASKYGVSATPTFIFFRSGQKVDELRGAGKRELEGRIEAFVEDTWPQHPHRKVYLSAVEGLPISPITVSAIPNYTGLTSKLEGLLAGRATDELKVLKEQVVPLLQGKGQASAFTSWVAATEKLLGILKPEETFPALDLWRIGALQPNISSQLASSSGLSPIANVLATAHSTLSSHGTSTPKPYLLTLLRLLTNLVAYLPLANILLAPPHLPHLIAITVDSLLHPDTPVRSAAAGLAVNLANYRHRLAKSLGMQAEEVDEAEWETELLTALVEAVGREEDEDVCHRLLVAVAQVIYLNKGIEGMKEICEVLGVKESIATRRKGWARKEVKKLADEITEKLI